MKSGSRLESVLDSGKFAVTAELGPPRGNLNEKVDAKAKMLGDIVDAINVTDNQTAVVRLSSMAVSARLVSLGHEPVLQMVTRDRNRIALQSDVLGAASLGIKNMLCLSGDHQSFGNQKHAKGVYDIDSLQLIAAVKRIRDEGMILDSGDPLEGEVRMFIGAAENPFAEPREFRPLRLRKKAEAGADFIQTQCIYDISLFREFMKEVTDLGLHERCHILAGVTPLKSYRMASYMAERVAGVVIPESILRRMKDAPEGKGAETGIAICCELIEELRSIEGVHGLHLMAIEWESRVREILEKTGLLPADRDL